MADSLTILLEILRDRDIPYDREALKSALQDPKSQTAVQAWMHEYLSPATLLSKEEAALYATLVKNGDAERIEGGGLSLVLGLGDGEIKDAVDELQRSTAVIEKQTEVLRLQQNAMSVLVKCNTRGAQTRAQAEKNQVRKWKVEQRQVEAAVEELAQGLRYQTTDLEVQARMAESEGRKVIEGVLMADDKLLGSLGKLAGDLEVASDGGEVMGRIRELCARLIKHTVEGIRTKLDRIYLEALHDSKGGESGDSQEMMDLQEELESLYSEILPVAQMSAEQQFLQPALREIAARDRQGQERSVKAVKYIDECLGFLVNRIQLFLERAEEQQCHKMALQYVLNEANKELAPEESSFSMPSSPFKSNTQRRRKSSAAQSPSNNRRRRSSSQFDDDIEPEQQLLRNLGISIPADATDQLRIEILERALADRSSKLDGHARSLQSTTESAISSHLADAQVTLQLLRDSLLGESLWGKVRLVDPEMESAVGEFEKEVEEVKERFEGVDVQKLFGRNVHKEQFVERWSR